MKTAEKSGTTSWAVAAALLRVVNPIDIVEGEKGAIRMVANFPITGKNYLLTIEPKD